MNLQLQLQQCRRFVLVQQSTGGGRHTYVRNRKTQGARMSRAAHLELEFVLGVGSPQQDSLQDGAQLRLQRLHRQPHRYYLVQMSHGGFSCVTSCSLQISSAGLLSRERANWPAVAALDADASVAAAWLPQRLSISRGEMWAPCVRATSFEHGAAQLQVLDAKKGQPMQSKRLVRVRITLPSCRVVRGSLVVEMQACSR